MATITITQSNVDTILDFGVSGNYYIVEETIQLSSKIYWFQPGCFIEFRGGSFTTPDGVTAKVKFQGSQVIAPVYCLFGKNVAVDCFTNALVHAEWFNDREAGMKDDEVINKAMLSACGCPVTLECRDYYLYAPIEVLYVTDNPDYLYYGGSNTARQTLISPGTLHVQGDFPAIDVYPPNVTLEINSIVGKTGSGAGGKYLGTGIRLSGANYHLNISVNQMTSLNKGFEIFPDSKKEIWFTYKDEKTQKEYKLLEPIGLNRNAGIQYCKIDFQYIRADYCMYIDVYSKNYIRDLGAGKYNGTTWFNECQISGGCMTGDYGIYVKDKEEAQIDKTFKDEYSMDGLMFSDITFQDMTATALRLRRMQLVKFHNIDTRGSMPGTDGNGAYLPWFDFKNFKYSDIAFKGYIRPNRFKIAGEMVMVKANGYIIDDEGWYTTRFDTLVFMPVYDTSSKTYNPHMAATNSVQPYNMGRLLIADAPPAGGVFTDKIFTLNDLLPVNEVLKNDPESSESSESIEFHILPRTVNVDIHEDNNMIIDLSGLNRFSPCLIDICWCSDYGGMLTFKTSEWPSKIVTPDYPAHPDKSVSFNEPGLYRLTWNSDWELVITKVTP